MYQKQALTAQLPPKSAWQDALANLITDPVILLKELSLPPDLLPAAQRAAQLFPLRVTRSFLSRMKKGDCTDPLLLQVLPLGDELVKEAGYSADPLHETDANPVPGLLHKYQGRVLVMLTSACAINCRYCFRREFPYETNNPGRRGRSKIMSYIAADPSIKEVILSGGDPLVVGDNLLRAFSDELVKLPQVSRLRIHSRLPIVLPGRINESFMAWVRDLMPQLVMVIHCNHPQEIDSEVRTALAFLKEAGVTLLNQAVLLKGINDDASILAELSEELFAAGVLPYYLHLLDKIHGTAHFDLPEARARQIHNDLMSRLPGYLVPRLVREIPEHGAKQLVV